MKTVFRTIGMVVALTILCCNAHGSRYIVSGLYCDYLRNNSGTITSYDYFYVSSAEKYGGGLQQNNYTKSTITIPTSVTYMGKEIKIAGIGRNAFDSCVNIKTVIIEDGLTFIGLEAFKKCTALQTIEIPNTVDSIASKAFIDCASLESFKVSSKMDKLNGETFRRCTNLRSIDLGSISTIGGSVFSNCQNLQQVDLSHVTSIGSSAFSRSGLRAIIFPDNIEYIGDYAFDYCQALEYARLPAGLTKMPYALFQGCSKLRSVVLPGSLTDVSIYAFNNCSSLDTIYFKGTPEQWKKAIGPVTSGVGYAWSNSVVICNFKEKGDVFEKDGISYLITETNQSVSVTAKLNGEYQDTILIPSYVEYNGFTYKVTGITDNTFQNNTDLKAILYSGSRIVWNKMEIGENNDLLQTVPITYNYTNNNTDVSGLSNYLYVDTQLTNRGTPISISVYLKNDRLVTGFQFELQFPEGITIPEGTMPYLSNERTTTQQHGIFDVRRLNNGRYLFVCSSMSNSTFSGNDGEVVVIPLQIAETIQSGDYPCTLYNIAITDVNANVERIAKVQYILEVLSIKTYRLSYMVDDIEYAYDSIDSYSLVEMRPEPVKEGYTFSGWDKNVTIMPPHNDTISGSFAINTYTITFLDNDGSSLQSSTCEYGAMPLYNGDIPTKPATAQYSYSFAGWSPDIAAITGDATYTAKYDTFVNRYVVSFLNYDGGELQCDTLEYGAMPTYIGTTPIKPSTAKYTYIFKQWTPVVKAVKSDAIYTAQYDSIINQYTAIFCNWDGTELQRTQLNYGAKPVYSGEKPQKPSVPQYSYSFAGWSPDIAAITGDVTYTAKFDSIVRSYTIKFCSRGGTVWQRSELPYGAMPEYTGNTPATMSGAQYTYTFAGWTPEITEVVGPATYTVVYDTIINQYTIIFQNYDGSILQSENLDYGTKPQYKGETPVKPTDPEYTYTFIGWTPNVVAVTGDTTYRAKFYATKRSYTITWQNDDGMLIDQTTVEYGVKPTYPDPVKSKTAEYTYTFAGWTPEVVAVTDDATYTAQYDSIVNKYIVVFSNYNGAELQRDTLEYGTMPAYIGEPPVRPATVEYTYTFAGWKQTVEPVTGNATYRATFNATKRSYTITWRNDNGIIIDQTFVEYGTVPTHSDPVKANTAEYTYTFKGWTPNIVVVTGDATYQATYKATKNRYTITWLNEDGSLIDQKTVLYGSVPTHSDPVKANTVEYVYTFAGWTPEVVAVTGDATYQATFNASKKSYLIRWTDDNGIIIDQTFVEYGTVPTHSDPVKANTAEYTYTFAGWTPNVVAVTGSATYRATFNATKNSYTITWLNEDGSLIDQTTVEYGVKPTHADPIMANTAEYTYTFIRWTPNVVAVTGDAIYQATYKATKNQYTITWLNEDGSLIDRTSVEYGEVPTHADPVKTNTAEYTYTFDGWSPEVVAVTGDATYQATFNATKESYIIWWLDDDETLIDQTFVEYGEVPTHADPVKTNTAEYTYTFDGWSPNVVAVTGDAIYQATYKATKNQYTITWLNEDGSLIDRTSVEYGEVPTHADPVKTNTAEYTYTFRKWTPNIVAVTGDATYQATFKATKNKYLIIFRNDDGTELQRGEVEYGTMPIAPSDPTKASTAQYDYLFNGWSPTVVVVTQSATYTATYTSSLRSYIVTFVDDNNNIISMQAYKYGEFPTIPATPTKTSTAEYTYTFAGWTPNIGIVTGDVTYKATFNSVVNMYSIISNTINGNVEGTGVYAYGTEIKLTAIPDNGYVFDQWSDGITDNPRTIIVTGDAEYIALFIQSQGIDEVYVSDPVKKVMINNHIVILYGDKKCTIHGQVIQ